MTIQTQIVCGVKISKKITPTWMRFSKWYRPLKRQAHSWIWSNIFSYTFKWNNKILRLKLIHRYVHGYIQETNLNHWGRDVSIHRRNSYPLFRFIICISIYKKTNQTTPMSVCLYLCNSVLSLEICTLISNLSFCNH